MKSWHPSQKVKQQKLLLARDSLCKLIGWADAGSPVLTRGFGSGGVGPPCEMLLGCSLSWSCATQFGHLIQDDNSGAARGLLRSEGIPVGCCLTIPSLHAGWGLSQETPPRGTGAGLTPPLIPSQMVPVSVCYSIHRGNTVIMDF